MYTGLVEKGDLIRRAIELELGGSHLNPSSSPFPLSMGSQREDGAGLIDIEETQATIHFDIAMFD